MPMNKVVHAAQRAAFSAAIDVAINAVRGKGTEKLSENAVKLVNLAEPLLKDRYPASAFDAARKFVSDPNGKWMQYAYRAINAENTPNPRAWEDGKRLAEATLKQYINSIKAVQTIFFIFYKINIHLNDFTITCII